LIGDIRLKIGVQIRNANKIFPKINISGADGPYHWTIYLPVNGCTNGGRQNDEPHCRDADPQALPCK